MKSKSLELYRQYSREDAQALLFSATDITNFSSEEFTMHGEIGAIFATIGRPPNTTYCLSKETIRWFTSEPELNFYNSIMLSFPSIYKESMKSLYLFAKSLDDPLFTYLGALRVIRGDGPSKASSSPGFPKYVIVHFEIEPPLTQDVWSRFDWTKDQILINGLPIPENLMHFVSQHGWERQTNINGLFLYPDKMDRETQHLYHLSDSGYDDIYALAVLNSDPAQLALSKAVCIGHVDIDRPICLDYRTSLDNPRVICLIADYFSYWTQIAENIDVFLKQLDQ